MNLRHDYRSAVVRDERFLGHKTGLTHPENPNRLKAIHRLLDREFHDLKRVEATPATLEQLEFVHTPGYIEKVMKTAEQPMTSLAPDTPASAMSYLAAWLAAGGCLNAVDALMGGRIDACFALVRPPGHHALPDRAAGFCIFNNIGVAALYAARHHGLTRVLVIDWDVHHGNGIQELFYQEKGVLYLSSHDILLYPYTGTVEEAGEGEGEGYTVNLPLPRDLKDEEFLGLYKDILKPMVEGFSPQLIIVAAGFDGHRQDPIGRWDLTEAGYGGLTGLLLEAASGVGRPPILFVLEGGYDPPSLARCVGEVLGVLTGKAAGGANHFGKSPRVAALLEEIKKVHGPYGVWI